MEGASPEGASPEVGVAIASMVIAVMALCAAIMQVNIQVSVESRRKGKMDKLALGDWAITWPQTRGLVQQCFGVFGLKSPLGDPRILTVPFITVGALEECLRDEALGEGRVPLGRRMVPRLVPTATKSITTGGGRFTGRMYAVRETTRKRSESCWSDALDMCGITRKYWPLLTTASALACDGGIRPANAVTNLHSLWGFARAMGLRDVEIQGTRITMTNGGASIYLDQYAGVDRPIRLAHFSGSPNGRYSILDEMSQQTAQSIYADAVWSDGCVPDPNRLEPGRAGSKKASTRHVSWPCSIMSPPSLSRSKPENHIQLLSAWAMEWWDKLEEHQDENLSSSISFASLINAREPAVISCIRTYPKSELSPDQLRSCRQALAWCVDHWWLDPYQQEHVLDSELPSLPDPEVGYISCEYITGTLQASLWCRQVRGQLAVSVERACWEECRHFASSLINQEATGSPGLNLGSRAVLARFLQCWKLHTFDEKLLPAPSLQGLSRNEMFIWKAQVQLLSMALVAVSMESRQIGPSEANKALEIELG